MNHPALDRVARCSRYGRRLLEAQPQLAETVAGQLGLPFTREAMQAFLDAPPCPDETSCRHRAPAATIADAMRSFFMACSEGWSVGPHRKGKGAAGQEQPACRRAV